MINNINLPDAPESKIRRYAALRGVDFSNNPSMVALNRSPDAKNIYKNYRDTMGQAIETRPGIACLGNVGQKIYGLHILGTKCLIHYGTVLSWWETFPNIIADEDDLTILNSQLPVNASDSVSFVFGGKLYFMDGAHYYMFDGTTLADVCDSAFIPTTRIGADPDGGNAVTYQGINLLQPKRKNSFVGNGTSTTYYLDATSIDANYTPLVWVNGAQVTTGITFNASAGTVGITPAPGLPANSGTDNVIIQFKKTTAGSVDRIKKCTIARVFDNRVFVSGNPDHAGSLFHSELNDPTYFTDTSYYTDGDDGAGIKALIQGQGVLIAVKENMGNGSKVYLHTPSLVYTDASDANSEVKAYPRMETEIMLGCNSKGINFMDDMVFLSPMGLEAIYIDNNNSSLQHRSSLIDTKFISESYFENAELEIWNNYLMILVNGKIYLADSRQKYKGANYMEYEWYYWDNIGVSENGIFSPACLLKEYDEVLFFACENGAICKFSGMNDNGILTVSYWTTPMDNFGTSSLYKSTKKRGSMAQIKRIPNSIIKIDVMTDKESWNNVFESSTSGFTYGIEFEYTNFIYGTGIRGDIFFHIKKRKIKELALKFYSDVINKPFGLYDTTLEIIIQNYIRY